MSEEYNGWTNRETWAFMLNVDNDEGLYHESRDLVSGEENDVFSAAQLLENWAETLLTRSGYESEFGADWPDALADMAAEIGSLWRIDWVECANAILEG